MSQFDTDLQAIADNIFAISPAGCIRLLESLQLYRTTVRVAFDEAMKKHTETQVTGNAEAIRQAMAEIMTTLQELSWQLDLDFIDWKELDTPEKGPT